MFSNPCPTRTSLTVSSTRAKCPAFCTITLALINLQLLHPKRHHLHTATRTDLPPPLRPNPQPSRHLSSIPPMLQQFLPTGIEVPPGRGALIRTLLLHRKSHAASCMCSCVGNTNQQSGDLPRVPPLFYKVPAGMGSGQMYDQATPRPHGCHYHHGLHPRPNRGSHWARSLADAL